MRVLKQRHEGSELDVTPLPTINGALARLRANGPSREDEIEYGLNELAKIAEQSKSWASADRSLVDGEGHITMLWNKTRSSLDKCAVPVLEGFLADGDTSVGRKKKVCAVLKIIGTPKAEATLRHFAEEGEREVRQAACQNLAYLLLDVRNPSHIDGLGGKRNEVTESLPIENETYRITHISRWTFPGGALKVCPMLLLEVPKDNRIAILGYNDRILNIEFIQGIRGANYDKAEQALGMNPAEFLLRHYIRTAKPVIELGFPIIFLAGADLNSWATESEWPWIMKLRDNYFNKAGILSLDKKRTREILEMN